MSARDNKFLIVAANVVLTPVIEPVIIALDPHFERANHKAIVTSGKRNEEDQLRIIRQYLKSKKLDIKYPEAMNGTAHDKLPDGNYNWQMGWSALLNASIIINPPLDAVLLMNYFNAKGVNRKGDLFRQTPHATGKPFDIGGGDNGLNDEIAIIEEAKKDIPAIVGWVIERKNNCLHVECK